MVHTLEHPAAPQLPPTPHPESLGPPPLYMTAAADAIAQVGFLLAHTPSEYVEKLSGKLPAKLPEPVKEGIEAALPQSHEIGRTLAEYGPRVLGILPLVELVRVSVREEVDLDPKQLEPHMQSLAAVAPLANKALWLWPTVKAGKSVRTDLEASQRLEDRKERAEVRKAAKEQLKPITWMLRGARAVRSVAKRLVDPKATGYATQWINTNREKLDGYLSYMSGPAAAVGDFVVGLTDEVEHPREEFRVELARLADAFWQRGDQLAAQRTNKQAAQANAQDIGNAIDGVMRELLADREKTKLAFPLLSKLLLDRIPADLTLPKTISVGYKPGMESLLSMKDVWHSKPYEVKKSVEREFQREPKPEKKIDIQLSDVLGVAAPEILRTLESAATNGDAVHMRAVEKRLAALRGTDRHPLRWLVERVGSLHESLQALHVAGGPLLRDLRDILPVDKQSAQAMAAELKRRFS